MTSQRRKRIDVGEVVNGCELFVGRVTAVDFFRLKSFGSATIKCTASGLKAFGPLGVVTSRPMFVEECVVYDEQRRGVVGCAHEVRGDGSVP